MNSFLIGIRLTENEIRSVLIEKQREGNLTNDAMCFILKDLLADYLEGTVNEYGRSLAGLLVEMNKEQDQKQDPEVEDDNTKAEN